MLLTQSKGDEKNFVLGMVRLANEKGESISLETVTDKFVETHDHSQKPSLFDAIRQLKKEGLIRLETCGSKVVMDLPA